MQLSSNSNHHIESTVNDPDKGDSLPDPFYRDVDLDDLVLVEDLDRLDQAQRYLDENEPEECTHCKVVPCVWISNQDKMVEYAEDVLLVDTNDDARQLSCKRKALYRQMSHILNGHLGRGNRKPHTECVKQGIRDIFADPNGQFMGHRDA